VQPDLDDTWANAHAYLSQGASFAAAREAGKVALIARGLPRGEQKPWQERLDAFRALVSTPDLDRDLEKRMAKIRILADDADDLSDEEAMQLLTAALELKLVAAAMATANHLWRNEDLLAMDNTLHDLRHSKTFGPKFERVARTIAKNTGLVI